MARETWTRRHFVGAATALTTLSVAETSFGMQVQQQPMLRPTSQGDSPEVVSGGLVPLLESNVARPMRYIAESGAFLIEEGKEYFNRPLYGPNIPFRVDGGDLPEFSLYLPGHGGNLRLGFKTTRGAKWMAHADHVRSRYVDGRLQYEIRDALLGDRCVLHLDALAEGAGLWTEIRSENEPNDMLLTFAFGGVSGRKGKRNGDIGCEIEPVSQFFQVRPEECRNNFWTLREGAAEVTSGKFRLRVGVPEGTEMRIFDAGNWNADWAKIWSPRLTIDAPPLPALAGQIACKGTPVILRIDVLEGAVLANGDPKASTLEENRSRFAKRKAELTALAQAVRWSSPDGQLDGVAASLGIAADAIWDETQGCVMHGAVAWRTPLAGWRGPYALDVLGRHDRMRRHLRHWIAKQNITDVTNGSGGTVGAEGFENIDEAQGTPDIGSANSRSENLLHSNGDLSHNHYDMNLVFFDALLRHLRWTGDLDFAREVWPALVRHAAWERRLFRRDYGNAQQSKPLYEAYAAIWASDNLQYNGGGATHSSAYNVFLHRRMAELAKWIGEEPKVAEAYRLEAESIAASMRELLWMKDRGAFAESREWLGGRRLSESPAIWTVYHTIDSEVTTRKEAWQMAHERLRAIRKVPILGKDVPPGGWQMACSDWMPYVWSLTLLVLAENLHMALALFQAGCSEDAYGLLSGSLIDAGYRGLCPGNFPMSLQLDPHRQESQRDFGDPIGCASRAIVEGLWGIQPDLLLGQLRLRPQLPSAWEKGSFRHPGLNLSYARHHLHETWTIQSRFAKPVALRFEVRALTVEVPEVTVNGRAVKIAFERDAVGSPSLLIEANPAETWDIAIHWRGSRPTEPSKEAIKCRVGDPFPWPGNVRTTRLDDPQGCLEGGIVKHDGTHTVFAAMEEGACSYWLPISLNVVSHPAPTLGSTLPQPEERFEVVPMDALLTGQVKEIFTRPHLQPRSGLCSLNLPDSLLGGWANFDVKTEINDAGLRAAAGELRLKDGLAFRTPANPSTPNCCYLSKWKDDRESLTLPLSGRAKAIYVLLACTTFPQATRSLHGLARVEYADGGAADEIELRSPHLWWPVEQDYLIDDYVFRMDALGKPESPLPMRIDLRNGQLRLLDRTNFKGHGGKIDGGSATVLRLETDSRRALNSLELSCQLYGVVMGVLAVTLAR